MTFWDAYRSTWRGSTAFVVAYPLLALVPVVPEIIQHAVEMRRGMYDSVAAAQAADADPVRLAFGLVKVVDVVVPGYWVARFLAWRDRRRVAQADATAVRLFAPVVLFHLLLSAIQLFVLPRTAAWLAAEFVSGQIITCLLVAWGAAAPLGNAAIGPLASARVMARRLPSTFLLLFLAILPLMVPHYALGVIAVVGPAPLRWPLLLVDSLVVGWLAAVIAASGFFAARRACDAAGIALVPATPPRAP